MIYLDHNANSPLRPKARAAMFAALEEGGNASSVHAAGRSARGRVERAREAVAALVGAPSASVVFTSGGSEANAMALRGAVAASLAAEERITRIFVSAVEHESVRANALALQESIPGLKVSEIPVGADGVIDPAVFRMQLMQGKGRALVCIMAANNETGAIQPVAALARILRAESKNSLLLVDAVQAAGRILVSVAELDADYLTLSAHKIGGPQGAGALILRAGAPFAPFSVGAQETGRRGGTENVAAIAGFGAAAGETQEGEELRRLRDRFEAGLRQIAPDVIVFAAGAERLPNVSNFAIPGLAAETALIALDLDGIALSSGAACSSGKVRPSHVLGAMGVPESLARCGLRASFGWNNKEDDVVATLAALERLLARRAGLKSVAA